MKFAVLISAATAAPTFDDVQSPLPVIIGGELAGKGNSELRFHDCLSDFGWNQKHRILSMINSLNKSL